MKRINLLIAVMALTMLIVKASNYKILYLNDNRIKINGKFAKVGDVFNEKATVQWTKDKQAIKVIDISTKQRYLMASKPTDKNSMTVYEILTRNKHLSTHDGGDDSGTAFDKLEEQLDEQYDLLDNIEIPTNLVMNSECYFLGSYEYGDTRLTKKLKYRGNMIIIDKSLFDVDGEKLDPRDIRLSIDYVNDKTGEVTLIKDDIEISVYPNKL